MRTETLTFFSVHERLPDDGTTVIVEIDPNTPHSEPTWIGYLDGEQWRDVSGEPITVVEWAEMPKGRAA